MTNRIVIKRGLSAVAAACVLIASSAFAQPISPSGLWKTIDDETGKPKALVRIREVNGEMRGTIEKLFRPAGDEQSPVCEKCEGELKGKPIIGMTILSGMKPDGDDFSGGQIIDPSNGKTYKSKMAMSSDGKTLAVRGYIGLPMLGRTQTWQRAE